MSGLSLLECSEVISAGKPELNLQLFGIEEREQQGSIQEEQPITLGNQKIVRSKVSPSMYKKPQQNSPSASPQNSRNAGNELLTFGVRTDKG